MPVVTLHSACLATWYSALTVVSLEGLLCPVLGVLGSPGEGASALTVDRLGETLCLSPQFLLRVWGLGFDRVALGPCFVKGPCFAKVFPLVLLSTPRVYFIRLCLLSSCLLSSSHGG